MAFRASPPPSSLLGVAAPSPDSVLAEGLEIPPASPPPTTIPRSSSISCPSVISAASSPREGKRRIQVKICFRHSGVTEEAEEVGTLVADARGAPERGDLHASPSLHLAAAPQGRPQLVCLVRRLPTFCLSFAHTLVFGLFPFDREQKPAEGGSFSLELPRVLLQLSR